MKSLMIITINSKITGNKNDNSNDNNNNNNDDNDCKCCEDHHGHALFHCSPFAAAALKTWSSDAQICTWVTERMQEQHM